MQLMILQGLALSFVSTAATSPSSPRALFKVFVYHEEALQSSGYANWDNHGCGVFRNSTQAAEFITFIRDPTNRVGMLSLDVQPLYKKSVQSTYFPQYDAIVAACTTAGIDIELMESNAVPGDSCKVNCPSVCNATPNSANDSCTPSYMDSFHSMAYTLLNRYKNASMGVSYDIEQSDPASVPPSRAPVWQALWNRIANFDVLAKASRAGSGAGTGIGAYTGYSFIRPAVWDFSSGGNDAMMRASRALDDQDFFSLLKTDFKQVELSGPNGIVAQLQFCKATKKAREEGEEGEEEEEVAVPTATAAGCKVVIGFETSAEDDSCTEYKTSKTSFVWGGGLPDGTRLSQWIEATLEPILVSLGIDPVADLATPPYFIEHHASFMSYVANANIPGRFPAANCTRATCTTCCPKQKHTSLCPK
tara:strand:+ start:121 stop:1377 length:1257 start_codon:yes stop_codon:yes gene_type:complete